MTALRTHFTFRVDTWTLTAKASSSTSPASKITSLRSPHTAALRTLAWHSHPPCGRGARVIEDSLTRGLASPPRKFRTKHN